MLGCALREVSTLRRVLFFFEIPEAFHFFSLTPDYSKEREEGYSKKIDDSPEEKVRILQSNLVFVNALPSDTSTKEVTPSLARPSRPISISAGTARSKNSYSTRPTPTRKAAPTKPTSPTPQNSTPPSPSWYLLCY